MLNASAMRVAFFLNCAKFKVGFENAEKNSEKVFFFEIIVSELVALNCLYKEGNPCHRQSMC